MIDDEIIPVITYTDLLSKLRNIDDHTILTIILASPEGAPADAES